LRRDARNARKRAARLTALQPPFKEGLVIACDFDIEVVFERQANRILSGEIKVARTDQIRQPRRIAWPDRRHFHWRIGSNENGTRRTNRRDTHLLPKHGRNAYDAENESNEPAHFIALV